MDSFEGGYVVWKKNYFRRVININEPRGPKYLCTECDEIFNTRLSIFTHSKIHLKPFCVVCGVYTQSLQEMQNHMKYNHLSMVEFIPIKNGDMNHNFVVNEKDISMKALDINHNFITNEIVKEKKILPKKPKAQPRKSICPYGPMSYDKPPNKKRIVSRFGRCIQVKTPSDF